MKPENFLLQVRALGEDGGGEKERKVLAQNERLNKKF